MKHLPLIILLLAIGGGAYLRFQKPNDWDKLLDSLKAHQGQSSSVTETSDETTTPANTPPVSAAPAKPIYITPDTTKFVSSAHVADVPQPPQPNPPADPSQYPTTPRVYIPPYPLPAQPNWTWTTVDGKVFNNVVIQQVEADRVTITHDQESAILDMFSLPPDIQKMLNYDPDLAAQVMAERHKNDNKPPSP